MDIDRINTEYKDNQNARQSSRLRIAVVLSLSLHGVLIAVFLWIAEQRDQELPVTIPTTVVIDLITPLMQSISEVDKVVTNRKPETTSLSTNEEFPQQQAETRQGSAAVNSRAANEDQPKQSVQLPEVKETITLPMDEAVSIKPTQPPSLLSLREAVAEISAQQEKKYSLTECTFMQSRSEFLDCTDQSEIEYTDVLQNPVYLAFNPAREVDRARGAIDTVISNQQQLRANLGSIIINGVNSDYFEEELSQGIEVYSGTGNVREERLLDQIYRDDPVYQQAQRVLNSTWFRSN